MNCCVYPVQSTVGAQCTYIHTLLACTACVHLCTHTHTSMHCMLVCSIRTNMHLLLHARCTHMHNNNITLLVVLGTHTLTHTHSCVLTHGHTHKDSSPPRYTHTQYHAIMHYYLRTRCSCMVGLTFIYVHNLF